ncbi:hypothetical protein BDV12DRAFT_18984 [Aspergillus spectabilis]
MYLSRRADKHLPNPCLPWISALGPCLASFLFPGLFTAYDEVGFGDEYALRRPAVARHRLAQTASGVDVVSLHELGSCSFLPRRKMSSERADFLRFPANKVLIRGR